MQIVCVTTTACMQRVHACVGITRLRVGVMCMCISVQMCAPAIRAASRYARRVISSSTNYRIHDIVSPSVPSAIEPLARSLQLREPQIGAERRAAGAHTSTKNSISISAFVSTTKRFRRIAGIYLRAVQRDLAHSAYRVVSHVCAVSP